MSIKNQRVLAIVNERADKIVAKLEAMFLPALKDKRLPTEDEADAVIDIMVEEDESGKGTVKVTENKEWYVENQLMPIMQLFVDNADKTKAERIEILIDTLYEAELLHHVDEADAAAIIASKGEEW